MNTIIIVGFIIFLIAIGILLNAKRIRRRRKKIKIIKVFNLKSKNFRVGVIGAGTMGNMLAESTERAGTQVVAVHDIRL